jgi:hypothetical protein
MSTNHSVGPDLVGALPKVGRLTATQKNDRFTAANKKDRSGLCAFAFADGRHCRTPRRSGHPHYCYFHAQKEAQSQAAKQAGEAISSFFLGNYLSACDLNVALGRVFSAVAQGHLKPKAATALAYLGQTMNQTVKLAQAEYANVYGGEVWRRKVASCLEPPPPPPQRAPQPAPAPQPKPRSAQQPTSQPALAPTPKPASSPVPQPPVNCHSERSEEPASSSNSSLATHHSPLPTAPSPRTPLPPTSTGFAQQVLAGPPTGSLPANQHVQPAPPNPQPAETPTNSHSEPAARRQESAFSSPSARSTTPTPGPQHTSPQPSQPTHNSQLNSQLAPTPPAPTPVNCHSERSEEPASSSNSSLATHHSPLPHNPPLVPPGFGAPANWDALIPPKPRRRFSRHWHLRD